MLLHELKNPLASIRLATQTLLAGSSRTPQEQARLTNINQSIDGMDAVMDRCRQMDRFEQGHWSAEKNPLDVSLLMMQCLDALPQRQRIEAELPESLPALQDLNLLRTMTLNLLDNALAYSPPDSVVTLQLQTQTNPAGQRQFMLTLRNAVGRVGVPDPARVFSKYYRAKKAHQRTGSGLGLFLVKGLTHLAGGDIAYRTEMRSDDTVLVVFELCLPCQ